MPFHSAARRWRVEPAAGISWSLACAAAVLLLIGLLFYLTFRSALPVGLQELHIAPFPSARHIHAGLFAGSFPNLVHVAAFALLTCALLPANMLSVITASVLWAAIDILWEVGCNEPSVHAAYRLLHVTTTPSCTTDIWDIVASLLGAATAIAIAFLIFKLHSVSAPPKESKP